MPFTLPQSLAVKLKSSFVKLIMLHLIKSKIMNQGRNQTTCVAHLPWPHGAVPRILSQVSVTYWISQFCSMMVTHKGALGGRAGRSPLNLKQRIIKAKEN